MAVLIELTSDTNTDKESPSSEHVEHANRVAFVVRAGRQCGEDDEDNGRDEQRVGARPVVRKEAEQQLANDDACKGNVGNVLGGLGRRVELAILLDENGVDGSNDLRGT